MTAPHTYITTSFPYVNARPHIGFALEVVQADVLARFRRQHGDRVRFQGGTDDNSLKNVLAAQAGGESVRAFVRYGFPPWGREPRDAHHRSERGLDRLLSSDGHRDQRRIR